MLKRITIGGARRIAAAAVALAVVGGVTAVADAAAATDTAAALKDTAPFAVGAAIDQREVSGAVGDLVAAQFDQVTAENHMKPDAWYDANRVLRMHSQAAAIVDFAKNRGLEIYGHTLVWHAQTPKWFFQNSSGEALTTSQSDQDLLRERMRSHIFGVARLLSERAGLFGDGNPVTAFDVVNEVISDGPESDGLRRSEWYRILGEGFIDQAFRYADEAFNGLYAEPGAERPVKLFINDYNTELASKRSRYIALVDRLRARGVPIDGVGHQFHVRLTVPVSAMADAIDAFTTRGVTQAVTELDVPTGTPVTSSLLDAQGTYYRDAFAVFHARASALRSVTVWGVTDSRSWRAADGAPLLFFDDLSAKPALRGALAAAPVPPVELDVATRCVAGRVVLTATVWNTGSATAAITVSTPFGSRALTIAPGGRAAHAFSTRAVSIPAGAAHGTGLDLLAPLEASYAGASCS